MGFLA